MTIKHLLGQKGRSLWTIGPDATVLEAVAKMAEKNIGSLLVMHDEKLIGIITERDYARNVILKGKTSPTTLVRDIMQISVIHVRPEQSVDRQDRWRNRTDHKRHDFATVGGLGDCTASRSVISLLWVAARCQPVFAAAAEFLVSITIVVTAVFDLGHFGDPGVSYADQQAQAEPDTIYPSPRPIIGSGSLTLAV